MASSVGTETPANKFATAQAALGLALRLNAEVCAGRITQSIFSKEVIIQTEGAGLKLPAFPEGSLSDLKKGIENIVLISLSASALTADETLNEVFGKTDADSEPSRKGLRILANQLRNAFAHNPWRPRWVVFQKYQGIFPVTLDDGSTFMFDSTNLNGHHIKPQDIGGLEFWVKLLQHCERLVSRNET